MARMFLMMDGVTITSLEDLKEHFIPKQIAEYYKSGRLQAWLRQRGFTDEAAKLDALGELPDDYALVSTLADFFELDDKQFVSVEKFLAEEKEREEELAQKAEQKAEQEAEIDALDTESEIELENELSAREDEVIERWQTIKAEILQKTENLLAKTKEEAEDYPSYSAPKTEKVIQRAKDEIFRIFGNADCEIVQLVRMIYQEMKAMYAQKEQVRCIILQDAKEKGIEIESRPTAEEELNYISASLTYALGDIRKEKQELQKDANERLQLI